MVLLQKDARFLITHDRVKGDSLCARVAIQFPLSLMIFTSQQENVVGMRRPYRGVFFRGLSEEI